MSRCNWLLVLAAIGFLTGPALGKANSQPKHHSAGANQQQATPAPAPAQNLAADNPKPYKRACEPPQSEGEDQACQALAANGIAAKNLFWSRIGIGAVLVSLIFTGWAALAAAEAAQAARQSVEHAERDAAEQSQRFADQLKVSRDSADASQKMADGMERRVTVVERAYVFAGLGFIHPSENPDRVMVPISLVNAGKTPANVKRLEVGFLPFGDLVENPDYARCFCLESDNIIAGGETVPNSREFERPKQWSPFILYGRVFYDDIFRVRHESRFCMRVDLSGPYAGSCGPPAWGDWD